MSIGPTKMREIKKRRKVQVTCFVSESERAKLRNDGTRNSLGKSNMT